MAEEYIEGYLDETKRILESIDRTKIAEVIDIIQHSKDKGAGSSSWE